VSDGAVPARRVRRDDIAWAFQSYPVLLDSGGVVPPMLRSGHALDLAHRDRRLAIGSDRDGRLLVMLTEVDLPAMRDVPLGLTIPETAALMGALGAERAVALDGGISAQLRVGARRWRGWRRVPLALVVQRR
jgi:exopolysaccharide biosynthesis protein